MLLDFVRKQLGKRKVEHRQMKSNWKASTPTLAQLHTRKQISQHHRQDLYQAWEKNFLLSATVHISQTFYPFALY